jgi:hypothetical protein
MKYNHYEPYERSESAPSEHRSCTTHTGANPWLSHLYESYIENVKERGTGERERGRERERGERERGERERGEREGGEREREIE